MANIEGNACAVPPTPYCWLVIRHVCRGWRQVALSYPKLSSHISLTRPQSVKDLLDRSGNTSLYIYESRAALFGAVESASRLVLAHFDRIVWAQFDFTKLIPGLILPTVPPES